MKHQLLYKKCSISLQNVPKMIIKEKFSKLKIYLFYNRIIDRKDNFMNKIIFADKSEFELLPGASLGENKVVVQDFADLKRVAEALTKEGKLDSVQYKIGDQITGEYKDMKLEMPLFRAVDCTDDKKVVATFAIREKTEIEKRLDKLEKGQAVQDGAILELAGVVGGQV